MEIAVLGEFVAAHPGRPKIFTHALPKMKVLDCVTLFSGPLVLWDAKYDGVATPFYNHCTSILSHCTLNKDETKEEIAVMFLLFMTELGKQHTTAYTECFFQGQSPGFTTAVAKYSTVALNRT